MDGTPRGDANAIVQTSGHFAESHTAGQYVRDSQNHSMVSDAWSWTEKNVVAPFVNSAAIEPINATVVNLANLAGQPFGKHFEQIKPLEINKNPNSFESTTEIISGGIGTALVFAGSIKLTGSGLNRAAANFGEGSAIAGLMRNPMTAQIAGPTIYEGMRNPQNGESRISNMIATGTAFGAFGLGGKLTGDLHGLPLFASRAGIGAVGMTSGRVLADLYDSRTPTADEIYKSALTGGIVNSVIPAIFARSSRVSDPAKPNQSNSADGQIGSRRLASSLGESIEKSNLPPVIVGTVDGQKAVMLHDGSSASFLNGKWEPGIAWATKDFQDMPVIKNPESAAKILKDAADALAKSLEP